MMEPDFWKKKHFDPIFPKAILKWPIISTFDLDFFKIGSLTFLNFWNIINGLILPKTASGKKSFP